MTRQFVHSPPVSERPHQHHRVDADILAEHFTPEVAPAMPLQHIRVTGELLLDGSGPRFRVPDVKGNGLELGHDSGTYEGGEFRFQFPWLPSVNGPGEGLF